jgi:GMP synthase-like glutamine amidotransferase
MPILGVCFGAQLLARAAGGAVHPSLYRDGVWIQRLLAPLDPRRGDRP